MEREKENERREYNRINKYWLRLFSSLNLMVFTVLNLIKNVVKKKNSNREFL